MAGGLSAPNHLHSWGSHPPVLHLGAPLGVSQPQTAPHLWVSPRCPPGCIQGTFGGLSAPDQWESHPALPPGCMQGTVGGVSQPQTAPHLGVSPRCPPGCIQGTFGGLSAPNHSIGWGGLSAPNHLHRVGVSPCSAPKAPRLHSGHLWGSLSPKPPHIWGSHPPVLHAGHLWGSLSPKSPHSWGSHPAVTPGCFHLGVSQPQTTPHLGVSPCCDPRLHPFGGLSAPNLPTSVGLPPLCPQAACRAWCPTYRSSSRT